MAGNHSPDFSIRSELSERDSSSNEASAEGKLRPDHRLASLDEVALHFGLSRSFLYHQVAERRIPFYKVGASLRFNLSELEVHWKVAAGEGGNQ